MMSEHWCVFLGLVTLVAGGIIRMPEELPVDIAADNAYLDDFASNALLSDKERKIVALLDDDDNDVTRNINYDKKRKRRSAWVAGGIVKMPEELPVDIAADNAYLDDFASNALLSVEERKIVALLDDDDDDVTMNINYDKKRKRRNALVAGGSVKITEELPVDIAADNAYLDDFASNALLSVEERKIVALLERIESKFGTLQENEKDEFVEKISNYQDRFASTLAKVETIPGMYGLNVDRLRANLGIPATEEHVEAIHDNFEDVISGNYIPEANVEDESAADVEVKFSDELASMARRYMALKNMQAQPVNRTPNSAISPVYDDVTMNINYDKKRKRRSAPTELPVDIAADNAYLDDFASNALLSVEERKIVALLERIESKFGTLQENEKDEFVEKISNYQDRFASTLAKVETIPGMYGLNVDMLRANLGIPATEEHVEEIHDNFEDVISGNYIPEANVEDESGADVEVKFSDELASMARRYMALKNMQAQPVNRTPNSAIPPVYDDVTMNINYDKKRKRRSAPTELPVDIAADNAYLDDFASNALLSVEERKIVALLERIESKFGTLQENEKDEFVEKISNYQDRFASTLAKVETIPGMYGLNVDMLRANLGIPATEEHVEEIHDNFEDVISGNYIPEATVEEESGADVVKFSDELAEMAQLVNLVMVQIVQANNKTEPQAQLPSSFYPPQALLYPYSTPTPAPRSRMPNPPKAPRYKNMPAQPVNRTPNPSPHYHHLQSLVSAIPPVYDDVTMNINYDKKHKHRSAPTDGDAEGDAAYQHWYTNTYLPWYQNYAVAFAKWSCERLSTRDANPLFIDANQPCWVEADGVCGEADGAGACAVPIV